MPITYLRKANRSIWRVETSPSASPDGAVLWANWRIFRAYGWEMDGEVLWLDPRSQGEEEKPIASGFIKWDGCNETDWFDTHFCDPSEVKSFFQIVLYALALATRELSKGILFELPEIAVPEGFEESETE